MIRTTLLGIALASVLAACGSAATTQTGPQSTDSEACPVTIPDGDFTPPDGYPVTPARDGDVWFGTRDLWTALPIDGTHTTRKSLWWSTRFPGGTVEEQPEISVTWTRLDDGASHTHSPGTNAYTNADGWFMIAGIDPDEPGCWRVEASYKEATLEYVYLRD